MFCAAALALAACAGPGVKTQAPYASPDDLLADFDDAMAAVSDEVPKHLLVLMAKYYACRAFAADSEDVCRKIDKRIGKQESGTCFDYWIIAHAHSEAFTGGGKVEYCLRYQGSEMDFHGDHFYPDETAEICRKEAPWLAGGDLERYCRFVSGNEPALGSTHGHDGGWSMDWCRKNYAFIEGNPARCAGFEPDFRVDCEDRAKLFGAHLRKDPSAVAGTYFSPLLNKGAGCERPAENVMRFYRQLAAARHTSPGGILGDFDNVTAAVSPNSSEDLLAVLAKYYACRSYVTDAESECGRVDKRIARRGSGSCLDLRLIGLVYREAFRGGGSFEQCLRNEAEQLAAEIARPDPRYSPEELCRNDAELLVGGDVRRYCAATTPVDPEASEELRASYLEGCLRDRVYISGDHARCAALAPGPRMDCVEKARFFQALRADDPALAAGTYFAPLIEKNAGCAPQERAVMDVYRRLTQ